MHPIAFLALDIAENRVREADLHRRALLARRGLPARPSWPRQVLANVFAHVSRASARAAGRLDSYVADDLRGTLTSTK